MDQIQAMRVFVRVVEAGNFTRAADSLDLPKGTVTKQIQALEARVRVKLLNRTTRQFSLTEAGHTYFRTAADILKEIDNLADLVREIALPVEVDFLEASSYGDAMHSSREVRILKDLRGEIAGRDVLVVEDIVDTGFTLHHVKNLLLSRGPARLEVCALLDKPSRREVPIRATWTGFEIPDEFVVGYGIDFAQRNRNLPYIGKVRFTE